MVPLTFVLTGRKAEAPLCHRGSLPAVGQQSGFLAAERAAPARVLGAPTVPGAWRLKVDTREHLQESFPSRN